jgi:magnesium transporter
MQERRTTPMPNDTSPASPRPAADHPPDGPHPTAPATADPHPTAPATASPSATAPPSWTGEARLRVVHWRPAGTETLTDAPALARLDDFLRAADGRTWIDLAGAPPDLVGRVAEELGLHPLVVEDVVERNQRPKLELTDEIVHIVLFALLYAGETHLREVDIVLGPRFLLSVHDPDWRPEEVVGLRRGPERLLASGLDLLLWALVDGIVDGYFPVLDRLEDELDALQDDVVDRPSSWTLGRLFAIKRELIEIRRAILPAREVLNQLTNRQLEAIAPEHVLYFRDVYDHLIRVTDELDTDRELVAGTLEVYLSTVNNQLSAIMKRLTGVTVVLAGIGGLAGIFGMSEAGPALAGTEEAGFWFVSGAIAALALVTVVVLRRIDWI